MGIPSLFLDNALTTRLLDYLQAYRRYTLTQLSPSAGRNAHQRVLQAFQGRLIQESEQERQRRVSFTLTSEEIAALKAMVTVLRFLKTKEPASSQRDAILVDLTHLKGVLENVSLCPATPFHRRSFLTPGER